MENRFFNNVKFICIFAADFEESVRFYRDILGLDPVDPSIDPAHTNFYGLKANNVIIGIEKGGFRKDGEKTKAENAILLQFHIENTEELEQANQYLESKGVTLLNKSIETHYGSYSNFLDPDGNKIELLAD